MSELPKGWVECLLDDVLISLESGSRPKGGVRNISEGVPSIGGEHLNYSGGFNFSNIRYVPKSFADKMAKGKIRQGDILVVKDGATTGKTSIVNEDFPFKEAAVNEHVFICRTSKVTNPKFVFRFLTSKHGQNNILSNFQGSAQGGINTKFVSNTIIPIAPLKEQKRIVEKLDKLLSKVDDAKTRLEKIPVIIKRFRQSVLNAAVTGELTKDWKVHDKKAWTKTILGDLVKEFQNGFGKRQSDQGNQIVVLRLADFDNAKRIYGKERKIKLTNPEIQKYILNDNDILVIRVNGSTNLAGKFILYSGKNEVFCDHLIRIKLINTIVSPQFIVFCANIGEGRDYIEKSLVTSAGQNTISQKSLSQLEINLPTLDEQKEIVKRVEALFKRADEIETRYKKAKTHVDKLTQSILAKAFRGELVPQDPNDPPASELLEKIKAEKELLNKSVVKGKRSRVGEPAEKLLERISAENKKEMKSRTK